MKPGVNEDDGTSDLDAQRFEDVRGVSRIQGLVIQSRGKVAPVGVVMALDEVAQRVDESRRRTVVWNNKESRCKYWATRLSVRFFTRTAHSFACSALLALFAYSAALTRLLAPSLCSFLHFWDSE